MAQALRWLRACRHSALACLTPAPWRLERQPVPGELGGDWLRWKPWWLLLPGPARPFPAASRSKRFPLLLDRNLTQAVMLASMQCTGGSRRPAARDTERGRHGIRPSEQQPWRSWAPSHITALALALGLAVSRARLSAPSSPTHLAHLSHLAPTQCPAAHRRPASPQSNRQGPRTTHDALHHMQQACGPRHGGMRSCINPCGGMRSCINPCQLPTSGCTHANWQPATPGGCRL